MYKLSCIKCLAQYESNDPDPYLCVPCNEERLRIAKEVDLKFAGRIVDEPQGFEALEKSVGKTVMSPDGKFGRTFFSAKDLM